VREKSGGSPVASEGSTLSQWVVMDYTDVLVHIFNEEKRAFYALEKLWSDAPRLSAIP
jgi:ribosome-associated protein